MIKKISIIFLAISVLVVGISAILLEEVQSTYAQSTAYPDGYPEGHPLGPPQGYPDGYLLEPPQQTQVPPPQQTQVPPPPQQTQVPPP
ncbi:MAG TPA: hypothetical protein VHJ38_02855 [Nitrososphaeraceae archaeon]|nr:hypothetical protein [Nitrososphaeraceae archaeon]